MNRAMDELIHENLLSPWGRHSAWLTYMNWRALILDLQILKANKPSLIAILHSLIKLTSLQVDPGIPTQDRETAHLSG